MQRVLNQFQDARPEELDEQFLKSGTGKDKTEKKGKKVGREEVGAIKQPFKNNRWQ